MEAFLDEFNATESCFGVVENEVDMISSESTDPDFEHVLPIHAKALDRLIETCNDGYGHELNALTDETFCVTEPDQDLDQIISTLAGFKTVQTVELSPVSSPRPKKRRRAGTGECLTISDIAVAFGRELNRAGTQEEMNTLIDTAITAFTASVSEHALPLLSMVLMKFAFMAQQQNSSPTKAELREKLKSKMSLPKKSDKACPVTASTVKEDENPMAFIKSCLWETDPDDPFAFLMSCDVENVSGGNVKNVSVENVSGGNVENVSGGNVSGKNVENVSGGNVENVLGENVVVETKQVVSVPVPAEKEGVCDAATEVHKRLFRPKPTKVDLLVRECVKRFGSQWVELQDIEKAAVDVNYFRKEEKVIRNHKLLTGSKLGKNSIPTKPGVGGPWGTFFPYWDTQICPDTSRLVFRLAPEFFKQ